MEKHQEAYRREIRTNPRRQQQRQLFRKIWEKGEEGTLKFENKALIHAVLFTGFVLQ